LFSISQCLNAPTSIAPTSLELSASEAEWRPLFYPRGHVYRIAVKETEDSIVLAPLAKSRGVVITVGGAEVPSGGVSLPQVNLVKSK
jgi:hypothetical protein